MSLFSTELSRSGRVAERTGKIMGKALQLSFICWLFSACSSLYVRTPSPNAGDIVASSPLFLKWHAAGFTHGIWRNKALKELSDQQKQSSIDQLNIYIHGDGRPWLKPGTIAVDPSPNYSLTWALFLNDPRPSLFISRPCYFEAHKLDQNCSPTLWTNARYSADVVASLKNTVSEALNQQQANAINLVGFSGGGALAMLVAAELDRDIEHLLSVKTIAANLDHQAWAEHHDYSPLSLSLNPRDLEPLEVEQIHFCGAHDSNIPVSILDAFFARQGVACRIVDAQHERGWLKKWPALSGTLGSP